MPSRDADEVAAAYKHVTESVALKAPGAKINGILLQEMVNDGIELIVGMHRDRQFGPVILVGLGGVLAEILNDVALRLCPLDVLDVEDMLSELKGARLLRDFRGGVARDVKAVGDALVRLSELAGDFPDEIESIDINPPLPSLLKVGELKRSMRWSSCGSRREKCASNVRLRHETTQPKRGHT